MNLPTLVLLTAPVIFLIVLFRKRSKRSLVRSATVAIDADHHGVRRTLADGRTEEVLWSEVSEVDVFRTRVGPHKPAGGGVVLYGTAERGCIIPLDKLEASSLLVHIHHLPGFDVGALIRVVGADADGLSPSDDATRFLTPKPLQTTVTVWSRTPLGDADADTDADTEEDADADADEDADAEEDSRGVPGSGNAPDPGTDVEGEGEHR